MEEKHCPHCNQKQPLSMFNVNRCSYCGGDMSKPPENIYVAGGVYKVENGKEYFYLVHPSGREELPYIAKDGDKMFGHIQHHAHLYRVISESIVVLVRKSTEAEVGGVGAPISPEIPPPGAEALKKALDKGHFVC
jgi:hypothetical protein